MKNILKFEDFLKESMIKEGVLASKAYKKQDTVDILMDGEDADVIAYHQKACELLGEDPSNVCRLDSESDYDGVLAKAFDAMDDKFRGVDTDLGDLDLPPGASLMLDSKLKVVGYYEYGFVAYFFTSDSNF